MIASRDYRIAIALLAGLSFSSAASAQQLLPPLGKPAAAAPRARASPSSRAASCHNGASFDKFLAELKQRAVSEGVSPNTIAAASPYLTYDQSIVNRDRGQRVFGQLLRNSREEWLRP